MDVEFIKWMCGKAKMFVVLNQEHEDRIQLPSRDQLEFEEILDGSFYEMNIYPLLRQRVFQELVKQGKIYHDFNSLRDLIIDEEKMEKWNKHIYEQEIKENK